MLSSLCCTFHPHENTCTRWLNRTPPRGPFHSAADASFWHGLCDRKLKEYKLSEEPRSLTGFFNIGTRAGVPARLCVGGDSFGEANPVPKLAFPMAGTLLCTNTVDAFKS